jgi:hypothetical protein
MRAAASSAESSCRGKVDGESGIDAAVRHRGTPPAAEFSFSANLQCSKTVRNKKQCFNRVIDPDCMFVDRKLLGFGEWAVGDDWSRQSVDAAVYLLYVHCEQQRPGR